MDACKRQKLNIETAELIETETESSATSLFLIDLCTHCLTIILDYLSVRDIVNVAEANFPAYLPEKNKNKLMLNDQLISAKIDLYNECILKAFLSKTKNDFHVQTNVKSAPRDIIMLRHFGRHFNSLRIVYGHDEEWPSHDSRGNRRYEKALEDAIIFNCRETVTRLCFERCDQYAMNEIEEPFPNAERIAFRDGDVNLKLGQLNNWFPKMKLLQFFSLNFSNSNSKCLHQHFPLLESFRVFDTLNLVNRDLKMFIKLNPQLKRLDIGCETGDQTKEMIITYDLIAFVSKCLINLESLKLKMNHLYFNEEMEPVIHFESLVYLQVECKEFINFDKVKFTSPKLKQLTLIGDPIEVDYEVITKIVTDTKPKQLKIQYTWKTFDIGNEHFASITRILPMLREIFIECYWNDELSDAFLAFLVNNETITKLIGVFNFESDDEGKPCPKFCGMRQLFMSKVIENDFVAKKWTLTFQTNDDDFFYVDSVHFNKNM